MTGGGPFSFDGAELLAVRVAQIRALAQDTLLTPAEDQLGKTEQLDELVATVGAVTAATDAAPGVAAMFAEAHTPRRQLDAADSALRALKRHVTADRVPLVLLEVATTTTWPGRLKWVVPREQACAEAVAHLGSEVDIATVQAIVKAHKKALNRLNRASVPTGAKVALAVGAGTISVASAGALAPVIGTAIGGAMGLSGAAGTSAGLAFLGGGSLASGGFGMAGGMLFVHAAAGAGYKGSRYLATSLAATSRAAFVNELAKLHVAYRLTGTGEATASQVLDALHAIADDLQVERRSARSEAGGSRSRLLRSWREVAAVKKAVGDEREAERLAAARRAVLAEIRQLSDPRWRRYATMTAKNLLGLDPGDLYDLLSH